MIRAASRRTCAGLLLLMFIVLGAVLGAGARDGPGPRFTQGPALAARGGDWCAQMTFLKLGVNNVHRG